MSVFFSLTLLMMLRNLDLGLGNCMTEWASDLWMLSDKPLSRLLACLSTSRLTWYLGPADSNTYPSFLWGCLSWGLMRYFSLLNLVSIASQWSLLSLLFTGLVMFPHFWSVRSLFCASWVLWRLEVRIWALLLCQLRGLCDKDFACQYFEKGRKLRSILILRVFVTSWRLGREGLFFALFLCAMYLISRSPIRNSSWCGSIREKDLSWILGLVLGPVTNAVDCGCPLKK